MWPYAVLILFPILVQHIRLRGGALYLTRSGVSHKNENTLRLFWGILLVLLVLRHETIGRDLSAYKILFDNYSTQTWQQIFSYDMERGFIILNKL
jgi:hypothetical protein